MRFLFRLDLILHVGAGIFFWNFELCNKEEFMEVGELEGDERGKRCLFVSTVFGARKDDHILVLSAHPFFGSSLQQLSHSYFRTTHMSVC